MPKPSGVTPAMALSIPEKLTFLPSPLITNIPNHPKGSYPPIVDRSRARHPSRTDQPNTSLRNLELGLVLDMLSEVAGGHMLLWWVGSQDGWSPVLRSRQGGEK